MHQQRLLMQLLLMQYVACMQDALLALPSGKGNSTIVITHAMRYHYTLKQRPTAAQLCRQKGVKPADANSPEFTFMH
jgi:hypothetical protein